MAKLPKCNNLLGMRSLVPDAQNETGFCQYVEYAPYGSLQLIIHAYAQKEHEDRQITEPFIYLVFLALAEAIFAMNKGRCAKEQEDRGEALDNTKTKDWSAILHRDIKYPSMYSSY